MKKALFVILDDTLITTKSGRPYSLHSEDWKFKLQAVEAIKDFSSKGYHICIIANQIQIANNLTTAKLFDRKLALILGTLERDLRLPNESIAYSYCIEEDSYRYLPNPGLIYELACDFELNITKSVLLGNSIYDKSICKYSGIETYLSLSDLAYPI